MAQWSIRRRAAVLLAACVTLLPGRNAAVAEDERGFQPRLLQVRLDATAVPSGGSLGVTYWWQNAGDAPASAVERVFVHVRRPGEAETDPAGIRHGADHDPSIPTHRWRPGRVVRYFSAVPLPERLPPGEYLLLVGLFDPAGGGRRVLDLPLPAGESDRRYEIARFRILPAGAKPEAPLTRTFFPLPAEGSRKPPAPAKTLTVGRGPLTLLLDAEQPRPLAWRMAGGELSGDPEGEPPDVRILSLADGRVRAADATPLAITWTARSQADRVAYHARVTDGDRPCADFDLVYTVTGESAAVALEQVVEHPGYELIGVHLGRLVSAREGARLALPVNAGRLVDPAKSTPSERAFALDWFTQALVGVIHDRRLACAVEVPGLDDRLVAGVGEGWAALGVSFEHRALTRAPVPSLLLSDRSTLRLRFAAPEGRAPDWMDGARLLRAEVRVKPPRLYRNTVIYKIFCDSPGAKSFTTFEQALDLVRRIGNLTDGAPQVAYLVGWQHRGHDTGYPDVFAVNERLGGREGLITAMRKAAEYNAILSFHDNYDDAYEHSPAWDPGMVARDASGALMKGGVWAGGQSYILSFGERGTEAATERARRTLEAYPIRGSYHIDVLSAVPRRHDYNPESPASSAQSLAGKIAVIREFNAHGVDVTSEGFCAPFVGVIGHAWHLMRRRDTCFAGEERIPFIPFLYHGHATWGGAQPTPEEIADALLHGATFSVDFNHKTPQAGITDRYYLLTVPWCLLRDREMTGYRAEGSVRRSEFGPDTYVEVDDRGPRYRVVVDGRPIAVDFTSFAPNGRGDAWLAYSRSGSPLDYPAPEGWTDPAKVKAVTLTQEGPGEAVPVSLEAGRIRLQAAPATPYRVTYGG